MATHKIFLKGWIRWCKFVVHWAPVLKSPIRHHINVAGDKDRQQTSWCLGLADVTERQAS